MRIDPLVSINVITYNHEKYIEQTLISILSQRTNFDFEIVICDDCSTDHTAEIIKKYISLNNNKIRLRRRKKNLGLKYNYFDNISACRGKYVAICDGDDYWTNPNKLQLQIEFLEKNTEYSMCFHNAIELHEKSNGHTFKNTFRLLENRDYDITEILKNWIVPTASVVFRNKISLDFKYIDKFMFFDIILFIKLSQIGKIRCLNSSMCVYRRHSNSITNSDLNYTDYIEHLKYLNKEFNGIFYKTIRNLISLEYYKQIKKPFKLHKLSNFHFLIKSLTTDYKVLHSQILKYLYSN